jgi:hypothetical protein
MPPKQRTTPKKATPSKKLSTKKGTLKTAITTPTPKSTITTRKNAIKNATRKKKVVIRRRSEAEEIRLPAKKENRKRLSKCCSRCAKFLITDPMLKCTYPKPGQRCARCSSKSINNSCNQVSVSEGIRGDASKESYQQTTDSPPNASSGT